MNATASNRTRLTHITRLPRVALVAFALVLVTTEMSAATVDELPLTRTATGVVSPTARDDCLAGRRRTGTSAFRIGIDPAPTCSVLLRGLGPGASGGTRQALSPEQRRQLTKLEQLGERNIRARDEGGGGGGGGAAKAAPYYYGGGDPYTNRATKRRSQEWSHRYGLLP